MKITPLGAAGEVTGSSYLIETPEARVLLDLGMFQGGRDDYKRNIIHPLVKPESLDAVLVTHAHNDHIGRLPLLPAAGFRGPIFATPATCALAVIMLRDAGHIQESDTIRINYRRARRGAPPITPLYTGVEVEQVLPLFKPAAMSREISVAPGITARWTEAGHILGSASIILSARDGDTTKHIVFSGDVGVVGAPVLADPDPPHPVGVRTDLVFLESTYGDRDHKPLGPTIDEFVHIIKEAVWSKQKILIPTFAVGRTQTLIYYLRELMASGRVPRFPVYIDSPMAIEAVNLYRKHPELHDDAARVIAADGHDPLDFPGLALCKTADESRRLNSLEGAAVIMAGSGMCTGGRILHHLKHNLWRRDAQLLIVGFQSKGSLGREIVEGAKEVKIMGEWIAVRAKIHTLGGFSAHAGRSGLLNWAATFAPPASQPSGKWPRFALTHGEEAPRQALANSLRQRGITNIILPNFAQAIEL